MTHAEEATQYTIDVVHGDIPTNKWVKLACQRQLNDLERKRFKYRFNLDKADKICNFIELLPHTKGQWAKKRLKIKLGPWQKFVLTTTFGWEDKKTGFRRFRDAYIEVCRKNGKSIIAAGVGLYCLVEDDEYGAEVYSGATSEKQAWEVFKPARLMVLRTKDLQDFYGLEVMASNISRAEDASKFEPLIGNPGDGASPSCAIIDEFHEHDSSDLYDTMDTGMGARDQPLMFIITTAGTDISSACYDKRDEVCKVLNGVYSNENLFGIIYGIDKNDNWADPASLIKANPNYGVSVAEPYLLSKQKEAIRRPTKQASFKTKNLNLWVTARNPWANMLEWKECGDSKLNINKVDGDITIHSLDLASKIDIAAYGVLFKKEERGADHYYWFPFFYIPESALDNDRTGKYAKWVKQGYLKVTEGNEIDFDVIKEDIIKCASKYGCDELPYDPWRATKLAQELAKEDIETVEFHGTVKNMSEPMYEIEAAISAKRMHHANNPLMDWMLSNVTVKPDAKDNIYPRKDKPEFKIDGAVALIMAVGRAMANEDDSIGDDYVMPVA